MAHATKIEFKIRHKQQFIDGKEVDSTYEVSKRKTDISTYLPSPERIVTCLTYEEIVALKEEINRILK